MIQRGLTRRKLEQARFFAEKASAVGSAHRDAFVNFLEAGVVFGRSVTLHLQKEYAHQPGFEDWYAEKQRSMHTDPLLQFFKETRNFILKEGRVTVHKEASVVLEDHLVLSESVEIKVIRGRPWYRRSPKLIWQDLRREVTQRIQRWLSRLEARWRRRARQRPRVQVTEGLFFDNPKWKDRPAVDLLLEYLGKLEHVVNEAEARFGGRIA